MMYTKIPARIMPNHTQTTDHPILRPPFCVLRLVLHITSSPSTARAGASRNADPNSCSEVRRAWRLSPVMDGISMWKWMGGSNGDV
jgi:hypothetical protein